VKAPRRESMISEACSRSSLSQLPVAGRERRDAFGLREMICLHARELSADDAFTGDMPLFTRPRHAKIETRQYQDGSAPLHLPKPAAEYCAVALDQISQQRVLRTMRGVMFTFDPGQPISHAANTGAPPIVRVADAGRTLLVTRSCFAVRSPSAIILIEDAAGAAREKIFGLEISRRGALRACYEQNGRPRWSRLLSNSVEWASECFSAEKTLISPVYIRL